VAKIAEKIRPAVRKRAGKTAGWQAEKSAMTRNAILEAAIQCIIELGYANTTTALIADYAGVSRGAMMHHFPSRASVLKATIEYLHHKRLSELGEIIPQQDKREEEDRRILAERLVKAAWEYMNLPSSIAYMEIMMAARSDEELSGILEPLEKDFEKQFVEIIQFAVPERKGSESLEVASHLMFSLLSGLMLNTLKHENQRRTKQLLGILVDNIASLTAH
jgi:AcrR family transcriptional regulator